MQCDDRRLNGLLDDRELIHKGTEGVQGDRLAHDERRAAQCGVVARSGAGHGQVFQWCGEDVDDLHERLHALRLGRLGGLVREERVAAFHQQHDRTGWQWSQLQRPAGHGSAEKCGGKEGKTRHGGDI